MRCAVIQAATGAFGTSDAAMKEKGGGTLTEAGNTAAGGVANSNSMPPGFSGPSSINQHRMPSKMQGAPYRSAVCFHFTKLLTVLCSNVSYFGLCFFFLNSHRLAMVCKHLEHIQLVFYPEGVYLNTNTSILNTLNLFDYLKGFI